MPFTKTNNYEDNKSTPINYWEYGGFSRIVTNVLRPEAAIDSNGMPIPTNGIVILMNGYTSQAAKQAAPSNSAPDKIHEFLFFNWFERNQVTRPATLDEKKAISQFTDLTDDQLNSISYDLLLSTTEIPHNDFDTAKAAINTPTEAIVMEGLLKNSPCSIAFFADATNVT